MKLTQRRHRRLRVAFHVNPTAERIHGHRPILRTGSRRGRRGRVLHQVPPVGDLGRLGQRPGDRLAVATTAIAIPG